MIDKVAILLITKINAHGIQNEVNTKIDELKHSGFLVRDVRIQGAPGGLLVSILYSETTDSNKQSLNSEVQKDNPWESNRNSWYESF